MSTTEQVKCTQHSKSLILWLVLVAALSTGFGYSLGVRESVAAVLKLSDEHTKERISMAEQHAEERLSMRRHYSKLVGEWKKKYEAQEEAYKKLANKAVSQ